tara:strand:- start:330 stop:623 length:294 start_codon:yes stop_codon:yes gene_type:complete
MAINHNVQLQSMLYSFNNSALYLGNTKVESMEMLVPQMVKAFTQLRDQINSYPVSDCPYQKEWVQATIKEAFGLVDLISETGMLPLVYEQATKQDRK